MNIFLITVNCVLLAAIIVMLFLRAKTPNKADAGSMENMDLVEFQHNLKELVEQLNRTASNNVKAMETAKASLEEAVRTAEARAGELRYLIERASLRREAQYKEAIAETPVVEPVLPFEQQQPQQPESPSRFTMNDADDTQAAQPQGAPKDKYQHITSLLRNGMSVEDISKVTGLTRGEIDLIKNIKKP